MKEFDKTLGIKHLHTLIICVKSLNSRTFLETLKYFSRKSEPKYLHQILSKLWCRLLSELRKRFHQAEPVWVPGHSTWLHVNGSDSWQQNSCHCWQWQLWCYSSYLCFLESSKNSLSDSRFNFAMWRDDLSGLMMRWELWAELN